MAERIFRALMHLYPREFRCRYGAEQVEFLRQDQQSMATEGWWRGVFVFWAKTGWDVVSSAARVWARSLRGRGPSHGRARGDGPRLEPDGPFWLEAPLQDARFALRTLRRRPAFAAMVIGILGAGIGASTTLFSAVDGVLLRPLPYPDSDRLVFLGANYPEGSEISQLPLPDLMDVMAGIRSVEAYGAARGQAFDLFGDGEPERVAVSQVSPDFFHVLGVTPAMGRTFTAEEHRITDAKVVMVSDGLWRRHWGADPDIVGRTFLASDGRSPEFQTYTVVGVLPAGFRNPTVVESPFSRLPAAEIWGPLPLNGEAYASPRTNYHMRTIARLGDGYTLESLTAELDALAAHLVEAFPEGHVRGDRYLGLGAKPLLDQVVGSRRSDLLILLGATGLLLLIACANVAGLLLARTLDRTRELGLRVALGVGRRRLFTQLLTESLVLALSGGGLGVGVAVLGVRAFRALGPAGFPRLMEVSVNPWVLGFGVGVSVLTGLLFGIGPALAGSKHRDGSILSPGTRTSTMSLGTVRLRSGLVALEVALALVLLTGCGLLARSVSRLRSVDPGIEAENLALVQVHLLPSYDSDEERRAFFQDLQDRIGALPGVISVSHVADPPMGFNQQSPQLWREEDAVRGEASESGNLHRVGLEYFRTMGIPLLRGRSFSGADDADAPPVLVLSQGMAEGLWPGEDPLGRLINLSKDHDGPWYTVVGVVGDIRQNSLRSGPGMDLYAPYAQNPADRGLFMAVRTAGEPLDLSGALREAVWSIDRNIPVPEITTMKGRVDATLRLDRFRALLLAAFAGVALLLATTGIYGTLTYVVGRRTPEVGIRMALGADAGAVVWMVLRQGVTPVMVGVVLGLAGSLAATRVLESFLFEVSPNDPLTFGVVASVLMGVSLLASYFPARRASRVDPQQALRAE